MVARVKEITATRSTKLSNAKTTKGPKVVMRYQKLSRGPNCKRKVTDSKRWFGSVVGLITNLCEALERSNFMLVQFWALLWIMVQSVICVKLASYNLNCKQTVMNQRLKFKSYVVLYTKKVWSKFQSKRIIEEEMVQAAKCHFVTF